MLHLILWCMALSLVSAVFHRNDISFESLESKTSHQEPVFNQIRFMPGLKKDIWIMRQSDHGFHSEKSEWDRLAIVVDKTTTPTRAAFFQLKPGTLEWDVTVSDTQPFRARCFACHSNGPRAIRPNADSISAPLGVLDRVLIEMWNFRIKSYGRVASVAGSPTSKDSPFKGHGVFLQSPLPLQSCQKCHSENGIRGRLTMEQLSTAAFLVKNKAMPPFPFSISEKEKNLLLDWAKLK